MLVRKIAKTKLVLLILISVILATGANIFVGYLFLPSALTQRTVVIIEPGLSVSQISQKLAKAEVIDYPELFSAIGSIYAYFSPFKSGEYQFTARATPYQIMHKLAVGRSVVHRLFIPEGTTINNIIGLVNSENKMVGQVHGNIPEGYLMPSTYFYSYGDQRNNIIDKMRQKMSAALDEAMAQLKADSPLKTRQDVLTLASIIEKEAGNNQERPMIAGVFINRLRKNMRLQADPTVIYGITEGKYNLARPLTRADLRTQTAYNTYKIYGLPPGPISCPGYASIMAAVKPAKTRALYFVVNGKGGHSFASSLAEHNENVRKFRQRQRAKRAKK